MSPASGIVLGAAAIVASPALWDSLVAGSMPLEVGLTRYLIAVGVCWVLLSILGEMVLTKTPGPVRDEEPASTDDASVS
jgi:hypothetical protein